MQHGTQVLRKRKVLCTSSSDMHQLSSQERPADHDSYCKAADVQHQPEVSSSMEGDCAGCSSAHFTRGNTALQRLASIALRL